MIGARNRLTRRRRMVMPRPMRPFGRLRPRRRDRSGVDKPEQWRPGPLILSLTLITAVAVAFYALWLAWIGYVMVRGGPSGFRLDPDRRCAQLGFSCGALSNFAASFLLIALASVVVLWQIFAMLRRYRVRARTESRDLVPTAGAILDEVVGRDELCMVVMADMHERGARPHVLVGGVGTGKTAVLVRLTELLADQRAVPVPIRLRDATDGLDFEAMARQRFLSELSQRTITSAAGETIWRRLRNDGRIVVLADGLEEALIGTAAERERDNIIRGAIRRAHLQHLPLVIASRPHDPLRATDAAILALEPLSYEAALAYIGGGESTEDERRLAWIVETADVVEAPLYLQITRELHVKGLLDPSSGGHPGVVDTRGVDRSTLRLALLESWQRALITGYLREDVPLNQAERRAAVEHISALACVGLERDRLEVEFDDLRRATTITAEVQARLARIDVETGQPFGVQNIHVRLAAAWAAQLDLVEMRGDSVRFPHSLIQAYLGSRLLDAAMQDPDFVARALTPPGPGRELLIAMVFRSRATGTEGAGGWQDSAGEPVVTSARRPRRPRKPAAQDDPQTFVGSLRRAAGSRDDNKVLDMYAAAIEIDCGAAEPAHRSLAEEIRDRWSRIHSQDPTTLEEGKLRLVRRFGEAARKLDDRARRGEEGLAEPAYRQLYDIGCNEPSYRIQFTAAQEIGSGGESAYRALSEVLEMPCSRCAAERAGTAPETAGQLPSRLLSDPGSWRASRISAWLAPMLVGSVGATGSLADQAQADLDRWLRHIGEYGRRPGEEDLPISLEIAVAQGFKYAANRRPSHPDARREVRMRLAEQALDMLKGTEYWFSQLTLIQALCLLSLSDDSKRPGDKHGAKPEAIVQHWLDVAGRESTNRNRQVQVPVDPHPFVLEAAQLAVLALKTGQPQRYLWIDEGGVVGQVGSRRTSGGPTYRTHRLYIPPSAGWTALNRRAQQLVADVLLLLNLAERGDPASESERRLARSNRFDLPPCITRYRPSLEPGLTVGTASSSAPGTTCVDGCPFELCPYPPKGARPRVEMSEAFCRRQQTLLTKRSLSRRRAPWQDMRRGQLIDFWAQMADRARGPRPRQPATGPVRKGRRLGRR